MSDYDIHSCGYYCDRHACIVAQRDELRQKLFSDQAVKTYSGGKPNYTQPDEALMKRVMDKIPEMAIKVQDEREANYKSFAQSAQVIGTQKKEWVGLTEDEAQYLFRLCLGRTYDNFWQAIEAKLKEKNT